MLIHVYYSISSLESKAEAKENQSKWLVTFIDFDKVRHCYDIIMSSTLLLLYYHVSKTLL